MDRRRGEKPATSRARPVPSRRGRRNQPRSDRTRALVVEETIRCVREEGFDAASTRRIVERADVSWGVIQYHFGDREGLFAAALEYGFDEVLASLNALADSAESMTDVRDRIELIVNEAWEIFSSPAYMGPLEILVASRAARSLSFDKQLTQLQLVYGRLAKLVGDDTSGVDVIAPLLWSSPVGMMVIRMAMPKAVPDRHAQDALRSLVADLIQVRTKRALRTRRTRRTLD